MAQATDKPNSVKTKNPYCIWDVEVIVSLRKCSFGSLTLREGVLQGESKLEVSSVDTVSKKFGYGREEREGTVLSRNVEAKNSWGFCGGFCWFILFNFFYYGTCLACME